MLNITKTAQLAKLAENLRRPRAWSEGNNRDGGVYRFGPKSLNRAEKVADKFASAELGELVALTKLEAKVLLVSTYATIGFTEHNIAATGSTNKVRKAIAEAGDTTLAFAELHPYNFQN